MNPIAPGSVKEPLGLADEANPRPWSSVSQAMKTASALLALVALAATAPALQVAAAPTEVTFTFKAIGTEETPRSVVSLVVKGKVIRLKTVVGNPEVQIEPQEWAKGAVVACSSWWAGQGDQFFVKRKGKTYRVYHRPLYEESAPGKFKLIKTVRA